RGDWFAQLFATAAAALMWPNPFAHLLARQVRETSETAADDRVLTAGVDPAGYASSLVSIARAAAAAPVLALSMASKFSFERRIEMILNHERARGTVTFRTAALIAVALLTASVPLASGALQSADTRHAITFGANTALMILDQPDVQADLRLSPLQSQRVADVLRQMCRDLR